MNVNSLNFNYFQLFTRNMKTNYLIVISIFYEDPAHDFLLVLPEGGDLGLLFTGGDTGLLSALISS